VSSGRSDRGAHTVASWAQEFLRHAEHSRGLKFTTILPALGHVRLPALTSDQINDAVRAWAERQPSPRCLGSPSLQLPVRRRRLTVTSM